MPLVDPPSACITTMALRNAASVRISLGRRPAARRVPPPLAVAWQGACPPRAVAGDGGGVGRPPGRGLRRGSIVLAVPITVQVRPRREPLVGLVDLGGVDLAGAVAAPQPPAVGAGAKRSPWWWPTSIGPTGRTIAGRSARRRRHHLRRDRLVAAADQDDRIHRLGADHLLGVHRHQVAQEHAGRMGEATRGSRWSGNPSAGHRRASRRA